MVQKNNYPDWVIKQKVKGTAIYKRNNNFYLYKVTSKYNSVTKKAKRITEEFLGKITQDGLVKPKHKRNIEPQNVAVKDYGGSNLLGFLNKQLHQSLQKIFPNCFQEIIVMAMLRLIYVCPLKNIRTLYDGSYLSTQYPDLKLADKNITDLIRTIGTDRSNIVEFFKEFKLGDQSILFDLTAILNQSKQIEINAKGYKNNFKKAINLMYSFNISQQMPAYYRILPGNIREIKAFKLSIHEMGLQNVIVIADKGFYSKENIKLLDEEKLQYLIPLKRNSKLILKKSLNDLDKTFFLFNDKPVWYYTYIKDNKKIILYLNERLRAEEQEDYLIRIANKNEGYTLETFVAKKPYFGLFALIVGNNSEITAENAYISYKSRMHIEQLFDVFKNILHADTSYMRGSFEMEAWMFINHIATMYYYSIFNSLKTYKLLNKYSPKDILLHLNQIKQLKINNQWVRSEITSKNEKLIKALGFSDAFI